MISETLVAKCSWIMKYLPLPLLALLLMPSVTHAAGPIQELDSIKSILSQVGPALSGILFVLAGIFYAIGQILPPDKKANFHTVSVNIIIGAIVVGALSVASTSLAIASTHILGNFTAANSTI